ncbi:hypothetical protein [Dactylosporangium sp. CA-139066]|uniref:FDXHR family putative zinc-binding protein n=1 Tax=Dactylosporangium sp. CA-139066 TaxID=3239930 RepID=UPI003D8DDB4F
MRACVLRKCVTPSGSQAHCTACHETFTAVSHFDAHRVGPVDRRSCIVSIGSRMVIPPATPDGSEYSLWFEDGLWSTDEGHSDRRAASARMAAARAAKGAK